MIIDLDDDWRIRRHDRHNFVIDERITVKNRDDDGERLEWVIRGYFSTLQSALLALPVHLAASSAVGDYNALKTRWAFMCGLLLRRGQAA